MAFSLLILHKPHRDVDLPMRATLRLVKDLGTRHIHTHPPSSQKQLWTCHALKIRAEQVPRCWYSQSPRFLFPLRAHAAVYCRQGWNCSAAGTLFDSTAPISRRFAGVPPLLFHEGLTRVTRLVAHHAARQKPLQIDGDHGGDGVN